MRPVAEKRHGVQRPNAARTQPKGGADRLTLSWQAARLEWHAHRIASASGPLRDTTPAPQPPTHGERQRTQPFDLRLRCGDSRSSGRSHCCSNCRSNWPAPAAWQQLQQPPLSRTRRSNSSRLGGGGGSTPLVCQCLDGLHVVD